MTPCYIRVISSFIPEIFSATLISKDQLRKTQTKAYADKHRGVKGRNMNVGNAVIIKQQKQNKLTAVTKVNGSQIVFQGGGWQYISS